MASVRKPFDAAVAALDAVAQRFDATSAAAREQALQRIAAATLHDNGTALLRCHELLLFMLAHPASPRERRGAERELQRLSQWLKARRARLPEALESQGLPFADTVTRFSHDCVRWLLGHRACRIEIDAYSEPSLDLNAVLRLTLPSLERSETTAGLANDELLDTLRVKRAARLAFIVAELARLDAEPHLKDRLFDALDLFVRVRPTQRAFSKAFNRLPMRSVFLQRELLRQFDARDLMDRALPPARELDAAASAQAVDVIRTTMALTSRETDPATYLDPRSLRVFDLERGLSVAVFGMSAERQLALESYVGFTLFKNGLPAAYGGAWLLGPRSNFGMNIFEPFRGGESGYMMCQVLRAYRQAFGVRYFEVDAHQFGLDNPEGIATGAFWFYYRYGFRPLDAALARLAQTERQRIAERPGRRSSDKTLLRLTGSNVALNFGGAVPPHLFDTTTAVTKLIATRYAGQRAVAEADCIARLARKLRVPERPGAEQQRVLTEVALIAEASNIADARRLALLRGMVESKPIDLFVYQRQLLAFYDGA